MNLSEKVAQLQPGQHVKATFERTFLPEKNQTVIGEVLVPPWSEEMLSFKSIEGSSGQFDGQCLRQPSGAPGGWLVEIEILEDSQ